jgi:hypothetical protein
MYTTWIQKSSWALERTCSEIVQAGGDPIEHAWNAWLTAHPVWLPETPDSPLRTSSTMLLVPDNLAT